jgi:hypothetical protein
MTQFMGVRMKSLFDHPIKLLLSALFLIVFVLCSQGAVANTDGPWYVALDGNDNFNCLTPATACATINGAINKASVNGAIYVGSGLYTGVGDSVVSINENITLSGGWDANFNAQDSASIVDGNDERRGITIGSGYTETVTVVIQHFTIQSGLAIKGGGLLNSGSLTLENSSVNDNSACCNSASNTGGGIYNEGELILVNSIVNNNWSDSAGGGIYNTGAASLTNSIVDRNQAFNSFAGGIYNNGMMNLNRSAVINNSAQMVGGIWNGNAGIMALNNSAVSGNTGGDAAGIRAHGTLALYNSTIANNHNNIISGAGGIRASGTVLAQNSIIAGNSGGGQLGGEESPDCIGSISSMGYNIIGNTSGCNVTPTSGDLFNLDARLFPVAIGSGYHPLLPNSPAIDAGNPAGCTDNDGHLLLIDQRGIMRPLDGIGNGEAVCDIGSYEYDPDNPPSQLFLPVTAYDHCSDFFDDFSNPATGWAVVDDAFVRSEYLNGEFRILSKQSGYFYLFDAPICQRQNYTIAVDARWVGEPGSGYGIIFALTPDFSQYYLFDVNTDFQMFRLLKKDADGFHTVASPAYASAIHSGVSSNRLQVTRNGNQIILAVNGATLGGWYDYTTMSLTGVGIVSSPYSDEPISDARFDNFSVHTLHGGSASHSFSGGGDAYLQPLLPQLQDGY